ncbi:MAG: prepilin peptidase [Lentisphaerae bacterium]|nr:prepilin peptidase [Lentisphaerota bacterium]
MEPAITPTVREVIQYGWWTMTLFVWITGLCVGSFLNVVAWRLPQGASIVHPGSHCPKCDHVLHWWENIPILSWLFLRGSCSNCGLPISLRYPIVELITGVIFFLVWLRIWFAVLPLSLLIGYGYLAAAIVAIAIIDYENLIIPNEITFTGVATALILAVVYPSSQFVGVTAVGGVASHRMLSNALEVIALRAFPAAFASPRALALLNAFAGALFGLAILWMVLEAGRLVWGRQTVIPEEPEDLEITPEEIRIGEDLVDTWEYLLFRANDTVRIDVDSASLSCTPSCSSTSPKPPAPVTQIVVTQEGLKVGTDVVAWDDLERIEGKVSKWTIPREVMGFGDVKMLAMVGAFLGPDACIFVLMLSAVAGTAVGVALVALRGRSRHAPIPFGPFLSLGTLAWMLSGTAFVDWYTRLVSALIQ